MLGYTALLIMDDTLTLGYENSSQFTNLSFTMKIYDLQDSDSAHLKIVFNKSPDHMQTSRGSLKNSTASIPTASMPHGEYHYDKLTREMNILVNGKGNDELKPSSKSIDLSVHRCFYEKCITPTPPSPPSERPDKVRLWSELDDWQGKPTLIASNVELTS